MRASMITIRKSQQHASRRDASPGSQMINNNMVAPKCKNIHETANADHYLRTKIYVSYNMLCSMIVSIFNFRGDHIKYWCGDAVLPRVASLRDAYGYFLLLLNLKPILQFLILH